MKGYSRVDSKFYALLSFALHAGRLLAYRSSVYVIDWCWTSKMFWKLGFCLTVHHQLGKVIQMNQLDATMIY